jgi:hypothetical protein
MMNKLFLKVNEVIFKGIAVILPFKFFDGWPFTFKPNPKTKKSSQYTHNYQKEIAEHDEQTAEYYSTYYGSYHTLIYSTGDSL